MVMDFNETKEYLNMMLNLTNIPSMMQNLTNINSTYDFNTSMLFDYVDVIYRSELDDRYRVPMFIIGLYIAVASLGCIVAMFADLVHGLRSRKRWFPTKYFAINAVSLTVIAVAMKLPVDLSGSMPGVVDQTAKLGSMAFMCTMMANFLPSLATLDNGELLANIVALVILLFTLVLNICMQVYTGVIVKFGKEVNRRLAPLDNRGHDPIGLRNVANQILGNLDKAHEKEVMVVSMSYVTLALIYVVLLLLLLTIHLSSSLAILKSKQIIQRKYQQKHATASKDVQPSIASEDVVQPLTIEKLQKHVRNYWIMAGSGSPQFMFVCSATTTASGVICLLSFIIHAIIMIYTLQSYMSVSNCGSNYKASTMVILIVQFIGGIVGTVAPVFRSFAHTKVTFKVEKYWTEKLYDWKSGHTSLPFGINSHKLKFVIKNLKILILNVCIILQYVVVIICKIITWVLIENITKEYAARASGGTRTKNSEQGKYVLQLENDEELADKTLENLSKSFDHLIQRSEKKQSKDLMNLIPKNFQGVRKYDNNDHQDCWSLPVVTLTTIAVTLPKIKKKKIKSLLKSVRRGLEYVRLVEENLNATDDCVSIQKAAAMLWEDVVFRHKWLGIRLKDITSQVKKAASEKDATMQIVQLFLEEAKNKKVEGGSTEDESTLYLFV